MKKILMVNKKIIITLKIISTIILMMDLILMNEILILEIRIIIIDSKEKGIMTLIKDEKMNKILCYKIKGLKLKNESI